MCPVIVYAALCGNKIKRRGQNADSKWNSFKLLTEYQNGVFFLDVFFYKMLESGEAAQPVVTLLRLVSFVPVVNIFVPTVVIWQVVHILCDMWQIISTDSNI